MGRHGHTLAERLYQSGADRAKAVAAGVAGEFDQLEARYQGASIPTHIWVGFTYREPYSCDYHTGGKQGAMLRHITQELRA